MTHPSLLSELLICNRLFLAEMKRKGITYFYAPYLPAMVTPFILEKREDTKDA